MTGAHEMAGDHESLAGHGGPGPGDVDLEPGLARRGGAGVAPPSRPGWSGPPGGCCARRGWRGRW